MATYDELCTSERDLRASMEYLKTWAVGQAKREVWSAFWDIVAGCAICAVILAATFMAGRYLFR